MKKIIFFLVTAVMVLFATNSYAQTRPEDTDNDGYYNISTLDELRWVSENDSSWSWNFDFVTKRYWGELLWIAETRAVAITNYYREKIGDPDGPRTLYKDGVLSHTPLYFPGGWHGSIISRFLMNPIHQVRFQYINP